MTINSADLYIQPAASKRLHKIFSIASTMLSIELIHALAVTREAENRGKKTIECLKTGNAFDA